MKKSLTSICVLSLFAATSAIAAGSVRIGGGGSMRAGSLKTMPVSEQSVSTTDTARMALSKSSSSLSKKLSDVVRVKETQKPTISQQSTDVKALESRIETLEALIKDINGELSDAVVAEALDKLSDEFYTKTEVNSLLPTYDSETGDLSLIDLNGETVTIKAAPSGLSSQTVVLVCPEGCYLKEIETTTGTSSAYTCVSYHDGTSSCGDPRIVRIRDENAQQDY